MLLHFLSKEAAESCQKRQMSKVIYFYNIREERQRESEENKKETRTCPEGVNTNTAKHF